VEAHPGKELTDERIGSTLRLCLLLLRLLRLRLRLLLCAPVGGGCRLL
jgi:hypothetical protein